AERHDGHRQAHRRGGDLRHGGVGAGADVGGGAGYQQPALRIEAGTGAGRHLYRLPDAGGHAHADQLVTVAQAARLLRPTRPTEALGTLLVAGTQLLAGIALALVAVDLAVVA